MLTLSPTQIDTFLRCPLQHKFKYQDKLEPAAISPALALGSAVHSCIKFHWSKIKSGQRLSSDVLVQAFDEDFERACTVPIKENGKTEEELRTQGRDLIAAYAVYLNELGEQEPPLAVEEKIEVPVVDMSTGEKLDDVMLTGFVDRIDAAGCPVEVKTARSAWSQWDADVALQMSLYGYALAFQRQSDSIEAMYEVIVKNKKPRVDVLRTTRTERDFSQVFRTIRNVVRAVDAGIHYQNRGFHCPSCDFVRECRAW